MIILFPEIGIGADKLYMQHLDETLLKEPLNVASTVLTCKLVLI